MKTICLSLLLAFPGLAASSPDRLVVHEWGTFTSIQDESGRTLGSINSDDEALPAFTHELGYFHRLKPGELPPLTYQGAPPSYPAATMRLETPVVYFHPPKSMPLPIMADVKVSFYSGWLTQFYPDAACETNGFSSNGRLGNRVSPGWLKWTGLKIGGTKSGPETTEHVWTAPRAVNAASVTTQAGESEKFLFYRGVGQLDAPLRVSQAGTAADRWAIQGNWHPLPPASERGVSGRKREEGRAVVPGSAMTIEKLWLAQFHSDGSCAYRVLDPMTVRAGETTNILQTMPASFSATEFSSANLKRLQADMRVALVKDGLFVDEADALLNTWELSYFRSWGCRLFFLVPSAWTDERLPIEISVPNDITRVMVGRIELVTPEHRALLRQLAKASVPEQPWAHYATVGNRRVLQGTMPAVYRDLGRFRNALILEEAAQRPTASLSQFIRLNGLEASTPLE